MTEVLQSKKITNRSSVCLSLAPLLLAALLILRDVGSVPIPKVLYIALAVAACFLGDKTTIYGLLAFIAPMAHGMPYNYICGAAAVCLLLKSRRRYDSAVIVSALILLAIEACSAVYGLFSVLGYFRFAAVFLVFSLFLAGDGNDCEALTLVKLYLAGFLAALLDLLGQMLTRYSLSELLSMHIRLGYTLSEAGEMRLGYNPNGLGMLCLTAMLLALLVFMESGRLRYLIFCVFTVLIGIATQSRTYLLVLVLSVFALALSSDVSRKVKRGIVIGGVLSGLLAASLLASYTASFLNRWSDKDISNGRINIALFYFREMFKNPERLLFGVGLQNYQEKYHYIQTAHNATQEVMITWGLVGLAFVLLLYYCAFKNARRSNRSAGFAQYLPLLSILVYQQLGQGFSDTAAMLSQMAAYAAILLVIPKRRSRQDAAANDTSRKSEEFP